MGEIVASIDVLSAGRHLILGEIPDGLAHDVYGFSQRMIQGGESQSSKRHVNAPPNVSTGRCL
jgi:hypothetical protein